MCVLLGFCTRPRVCPCPQVETDSASNGGSIKCTFLAKLFIHRPELGRGYPLNLSILISGGKENNHDSLSNGERSGKSPDQNRQVFGLSEMWSLRRGYAGGASLLKFLGKGPPREGARPVGGGLAHRRFHGLRVGLFGNAALRRWYAPSKAKYQHESDSEQVP